MKQQQIILHEATTILSHRLLRYGRRFRYVVLRHSSDLAWLSNHPLSLTKLTLFLSEATRGSKRGHTPLLLAAFQALTDTYLVVVWTSSDSNEDETGRNRFGLAFRRAAQIVRARVKHDGFDSAMIEVKSEDLKGFLQTLQTISL
jgi:cell division control protein 45